MGALVCDVADFQKSTEFSRICLWLASYKSWFCCLSEVY